MMQWRWFKSSLIACAAVSSAPCRSHARPQYYGEVTFGGLPVPGATITATQGAKTISVTSDEGGVFHFDDLPDGQWKIEVKMLCFETIDADVTIAPKMPAAKWELKLLPADQLQALAKPPAAFQPRRARRCKPQPKRSRDRSRAATAAGDAETTRRYQPAKLRRFPGQRKREQRRDIAVLVEPGLRQSSLQHQEPLQRRLRSSFSTTRCSMRGRIRSADLRRRSLLTTASPLASRSAVR